MDVVFKKDKSKKNINFSKAFAFLKDGNSLFYYYLFLVGIGVCFFAASLFVNRFTTPFTGDYTSQQYGFYTNGYDDWWHFFKTGEFVLYDTNTFLGVNNIGSNSFYYLFDPFFLPILLCPRQLIPQGMAVLTIFKMATAGMMFYHYMRYMGASDKSSRIVGLAYAFCGWTTWYLWFNHFTEVTIVFPLMLWGVERCIKTKKPWLLAFSVFLMALTNFFFCICCSIAAFIYAMWRFFQSINKRSIKDNFAVLGCGFFGFAVGLAMGCFVIVPAAMVAISAPRAQNATYLDSLKTFLHEKNWKALWNYLTSWDKVSNRKFRTWFPIIDFVFPVVSDRGTPLTVYHNDSYDNVAGSIFSYVPIMMLLVPALINSIKQKHFSPLIALAFFVVCLITPFCYFMYHGFTEAYSRWTLFVTTSLLTYVGLYLDTFKKDKNWPLLVGAITSEALLFVAVILAKKITTEYPDDFEARIPLKITLIVGGLYVGIVYILLRCLKSKSYINKLFMGIISFEAICMGTATIYGHGVENYENTNNGLFNNNTLHSLVTNVSKNDPSYYRCYSSLENSSARNDGMRNGYNGLGFFHSVYNFNDSDFLNWSAINDNSAPGSWSGSYLEKRINLDTFLGVKYYFIAKASLPPYGNSNAPSFRCNVPLNFVDVTDQYPNDKFLVYENKDFIDLGFSFDNILLSNYVDDEGYETGPFVFTNDSIKNEEMYLSGAILNYETAQNILEEYPEFSSKKANTFTRSAYPLSLHTYPTSYDGSRYVTTVYDVTGYDINNEKIKNYQMSMSSLLNVENEDYPKSGYPQINDDQKINDRYITIIKFPNNGTDAYDPKGMIFYLKNYYNWDYRINVYFVDTENHIVTFDDHNDQKLNLTYSYSSRKTWRGFYVAPTYDNSGNIIKDAPHIDRVIIVNKGAKIKNPYELYFEPYTGYETRLQNIKENLLKNVQYSTNNFKFQTLFDKPRIIVTQLPWEDGWSITAKNNLGKAKNISLFKAQGGFVSFVAPEGNYSYELSFYTPYLQLGSYISSAGAFMFLSSFVCYYYISNGLKEFSSFEDGFERKKRSTFKKLIP